MTTPDGQPSPNPYIPSLADIVEKRRETRGTYTYRLRLRNEATRSAFRFRPGQFNMVYVFGAGEVPISIVSDPDEAETLDHTIRIVGDVTGVLDRLGPGDVVGLRGPYGSWWPLEEARGKDVVLVTGGLGCAPVVAVINDIVRRRDAYGALKILHGIKTPRDLVFRERFRAWARHPNTEVYLTVDRPDRTWHYHIGMVTNLFSQVRRPDQERGDDVRPGGHDAVRGAQPARQRNARRRRLSLNGAQHEVRGGSGSRATRCTCTCSTRGGLASALNEIAASSGASIEVDERRVPILNAVRGACELLGFDPLYVANEGRFVAFVPDSEADRALSLMRGRRVGAGATAIGRVKRVGSPSSVVARNALGTMRVLDMLSGEQLPRIC